ncbi:energy transducer TonB [Aurantivibrio plasticivorans]
MKSGLEASTNTTSWFIAIILSIISHGTLAGIGEFNDAMRKGDFATAAAETQSIWSDYDKGKESAPTLAREFGFVNYMAGNYDTAMEFVNQLNASDLVDNQPKVTAILAAAINYKKDGDIKDLPDLATALTDRLTVGGLDNISLIGADLLYQSYWEKGKWLEIEEAASLSKSLYMRGGDQLLIRQYKADLITSAAKFLTKGKVNQYNVMGELHETIVDAINNSQPGMKRKGLAELKFTAQAWANAMFMAYKTYHPRTGTYIDQNEKIRSFAMPRVSIFDDEPSRVVSKPCDVDLKTPTLRYPPNAAFRGSVGSVVTLIKFDEKGKSTSAKVLSAVPTGIFARTVMDKSDKFYLEKLDTSDKDCQFPERLVQSFSFYIQ